MDKAQADLVMDFCKRVGFVARIVWTAPQHAESYAVIVTAIEPG